MIFVFFCFVFVFFFLSTLKSCVILNAVWRPVEKNKHEIIPTLKGNY